MPRGKERQLVYIWEYRQDGKLVVRAVPSTEGMGTPCPSSQLIALKQKVS